MDYEKAYKESFEAAKGLHDAGNALTKKQMEIVFPELAESEDERTRKRLIEYFEGFRMGNVEVRWEGLIVQEVLAWLEKQKEQKPAEWSEDIIRKAIKEVGLTQHQIDWFKTNVFPPKPEWSEEDEKIRKALVWHLKADVDFVSNGVTKAECLAYLDKQKAQKQEWSDEDKRILKGIIGLVDHNQHYNVSNKEMLAWLKSLRPQPKQEWSEEDEDMLNSCISSIEEAKENRYAYKETDGDTSYDHEIAWLKSLRPVSKESLQPHWKPSEEQMKALNEIINTLAESKYPHESDYLFNMLNGLRKNLKKL